MKIVYCANDLWQSGGTERVLTTKVNWLSEQPEHETWLVTLREEREPFFALSPGVRRIMIDAKDIKTYKSRLTEILNELRPDVTVCTSGWASQVLPDLADGSKKVLEFHYTKNYLVNFVRGMRRIRFRSLHLLKMRWLQWRLSRLARRYDKFVGLTRRDVDLWGTPPNMTYIYNPLSFRSERKSDCRSHRIIAVGSFTPSKGMDQLVEAFGRIAHRHADWHLDIYGSGQDEGLLRELIAQYGITEQTTLHSPVADISKALLASSIYAFPSRSDGFGLVITEAMECGLPTVAMDCECGPREIVTGRTGIVVPDKNIDKFAEALERLVSDESLRRSMGRSASEEVSRFYAENIMPQWLSLFADLTGCEAEEKR